MGDDPSYYQAMPAAPQRKPRPRGAKPPGIRAPPPPVDYGADEASGYVAPEYAPPTTPNKGRKPGPPSGPPSGRSTPNVKPKPSPPSAPAEDPYASAPAVPPPRRKPAAGGSTPNVYPQAEAADPPAPRRKPPSSGGGSSTNLYAQGGSQPGSQATTPRQKPSSTPKMAPKPSSQMNMQQYQQEMAPTPSRSGKSTPTGSVAQASGYSTPNTPGSKPKGKKSSEKQYVYDQQSGQYYEYDPATGQYYEAPPEPSYTDIRNTGNQYSNYGVPAVSSSSVVLLPDGSQTKLVVRDAPADFKIDQPAGEDGCGAFLYALCCGPKITIPEKKGGK